jgi:protein O-mannosyl-transferase
MSKRPSRPPAPPSAKKSPVPSSRKPAPASSGAPPPRAAKRITPPVSYGPWWWGLLTAGLGLVLYVNTFGHDYTLDDFSAIKENWVVKGGLKNLGIIFSTEYRYGAWASPGSLYRPLPLAMFAWEWGASNGLPWLGHVMNVLTYAATGWVLWITWRRILAAYPPVLAIVAVLLFMAHPVHTEVVANIKSRDEILALLFGNLTLYAIWRYFDGQRSSWLVAAALLYAVSLFSKESAITFMALFPLTIWFFTDKSIGENLKVTALMLIPALIFLLIRQQVLGAQPFKEAFSPLDNFIVAAPNAASRLASALMMCWQYLRTLLLPHPLVSDYGYPQFTPVTFADWRAWAGLLIYGTAFVWAVLNFGRRHLLAFAILWYMIAFSLYSNVLVTIGTSYGERLLYTPSFGFALALAWALTTMMPKSAGTGAIWGVTGVLLALYGAKTLLRNPAWKDSLSLYQADIVHSPNCAKLNYHYALEQVKQGIDEPTSMVKDSSWVNRGMASYNKAISLFPAYHDAYGSRGLAFFRYSQTAAAACRNQQPPDQVCLPARALEAKAMSDYREAIRHRPNSSSVLSNMGFIYFSQGRLDSAEIVYRESIKHDPRFADARRNLGAVLALKKNFTAAIEQWQEGLKYEPKNATLYFYIGSAYRDMGQPDKSQRWFEQAYAIDPSLRR